MPQLVKALSIRQPWAWLIVQGFKPVENRTWWSSYRGPVLIHAGKAPDPQADHIARMVKEQFGIRIPDVLDLGGIVGVAEVTGCVDHSTSPWFSGPYGFVLEGARLLPFTPCEGALGFFVPEQATLARLRDYL